MNKALRMLVIGAGGMGRAWLRALAADNHWQVAGLVDLSPEALQTAGTEYSIPATVRFLHLDEALEKTSPDAVLVVTVPETHKDIILTALDRGLPVLTEKPMTATLEEAVDVVNKVRALQGVVMVSQNRRHQASIRALREAVVAGKVGELGYITYQFHLPFRFGGWRDQMPEVLLEDLAIHHFDAIRFITSRNGQRIYAHSFHPPWSWFTGNPAAAVILELEGGLPVSYFGSWVAHGPRTTWEGEVLIAGTEGALLLRADGTVWHYRGEDAEPVPLPVPTLEIDALNLNLQHFTRVVRGEAAPHPDAEDNIHSLAITTSAVRAARSRQPVDIREHLRAAGWTPPESAA